MGSCGGLFGHFIPSVFAGRGPLQLMLGTMFWQMETVAQVPRPPHRGDVRISFSIGIFIDNGMIF